MPDPPYVAGVADILDAALTATLFHFGIMKISDLKDYLAKEGVPVRRV